MHLACKDKIRVSSALSVALGVVLLLLAAISNAQSLVVNKTVAGTNESNHPAAVSYSPGMNSASFDFVLSYNTLISTATPNISGVIPNGALACNVPLPGKVACVVFADSPTQSLGAGTIEILFDTANSTGIAPLIFESANFFNQSGGAESGAKTNGAVEISLTAPPMVSISDVSVLEGNSGAQTATFTIALSRVAPSGGVQLNVATANGTARAGSDYVSNRMNSLTIVSGQRTASFPVQIYGDGEEEADETFTVNISAVVGAIIADGQGVGTILNDDVAPVVPMVSGDSYSTRKDQVLNVTNLAGILANDSDPNGGALVAKLLIPPTRGALLLNVNGAFTYTPNSGYSGADSFTYQACNSINVCSSATVTLEVGDFSLDMRDQYLWMVPPASNIERQGFIRLTNHEDRAGSVTVWGVDATGHRSPGTLSLTLAPKESRQFNSQDLELGNIAKSLVGMIGAGVGNWTVAVRSDLDLEALTYIRTPDGFLTSMHDRVVGDGVDWFVPMFNPADNPNQVSHLRVINTNAWPVNLLVQGVDDVGAAGASAVAVTIAALSSIDLSATDLESGSAVKGLVGALGDRTGKWNLLVSATGRVTMQSLLYDPKGYLTNLSTLPDLSELPMGEKILWFVPPASNTEQQGFVRLINRENRLGDVAVWGIDDAGRRSPGTITFTLGANESKQFNSQDLERGNSTKGLTGGLGDGTGNWRLVILTDLNLWPMGLVRTPDGFLTTVHDSISGTTVQVPIFNPGENPNQVSELRLINPNGSATSVEILGVDDTGQSSAGGSVSLTLAANSAVSLTALDLENGNISKGLAGRFGKGVGKWTLTVKASAPVRAMSLLRDPKGYLTNLSNRTQGTNAKLDP